MKKKLLALFLTLCMALSLLPATALAATISGQPAEAEDTISTTAETAAKIGDTGYTAKKCDFEQSGQNYAVPVNPEEAYAKIGDTYYLTLDDAIKDAVATAGNQTITILQDTTITGGQYRDSLVAPQGVKLIISGGYFISDPSAYVAEDKVVKISDKPEYNFMIGEPSETPAIAAPAVPKIKEVPSNITGENKKLADSFKKKMESNTPVVTGDAIDKAAAEKAQENTITTAEGAEKLHGYDTNANTNNVKIVVQYYTEIQITDANASNENQKSLTVEITPMAQSAATRISTKNDEINTVGQGQNAVAIGAAVPLTVNKPVTVTIPLPDGFANDGALNIQHDKNGQHYIYTGTVSNNTLTFTSWHGLSPFTIGVDAPAAKIGDIGYATLQEAVDEVKNGETITLNSDNLTAVVGRTVNFTVTPNGQNYSITAGANAVNNGSGNDYKFVCTSPTPRYTIDVLTVENGMVTVHPTSAQCGQAITMTVKPDEGFILDQVVVTDAQDTELALIDTGNGTYTFNMPDSRVTVTPAFKAAEKPRVDHIFMDIDRDAWYNDAVQYVFDKGMMAGTSGTTFSPITSTTRGMIITMLYRLEGQPACTSTPTFEDVPADKWFTNAVAWGTENSIIKGYSADKFYPELPITRMQIAAILHRYAAFKGYDLTADADLSKFSDASQISAWAVEDIRWANAHNLITGLEGNRLAPGNNAVRAQVAAIFMRFCENVAK